MGGAPAAGRGSGGKFYPYGTTPRRKKQAAGAGQSPRKIFCKKCLTLYRYSAIILTALAPVAQLDRVSDYESEGREFESLPAHQAPRFRGAFLFCVWQRRFCVMCAPYADTSRRWYAPYTGFFRAAKDAGCMNLHFCGILPVCVRLTNRHGAIIIIEISGMNDGVCAAATATVFFIPSPVRCARTNVRKNTARRPGSAPGVGNLYSIKKRSGTTPWRNTSSSVW